MLIPQDSNQVAGAMLSAILKIVNRETESIFKMDPSPSDNGITDNRLLEAKITNGSHVLTFRFSEELVFQIVDLMTGGINCHYTMVIEKPFTDFELSVIKYILTQTFGSSQIQLLDLGKDHDLKAGKHNLSFVVSGPKSEGVAYVVPTSLSAVPFNTPSNIAVANTTGAKLEGLDLNILVDSLRYELPQTCALALQMLDHDSAGALLKMLPWELQQDVGVRFLTMGEANVNAAELLILSFYDSSPRHLKIVL